MEKPLISIIVPIYRVEAYLSRCIDSILNQSYRNLEIILVDDGSPDSCPKICNEYAEKDARIRVVHKKNGGLSDARNAGIDIANGKYISFIDSDDYIHPEMISTLFDLLKSNDADISVCNFTPFTERVSPLNKAPTIDTLSGKDAAKRLYQSQYATQTVVAWDKLYKRSLFDHLRFKVGKFNEDEFFSYRALYLANKVVFTSQELYFYFIRTTGISKAITDPRSLNGLDAKIEAIQFYKENGSTDILRSAVLSFLNFSAKRYCFVSRQKGNHQELLGEIKKRHATVYCSNSSLLRISERFRARTFLFFPLLYWFFIKFDKAKRKFLTK
ncbi:glycosyltransferase [Hallerella succinigenes]|uniref:glycosyltransferase n=1 Tax=Hallerella succinigenes TaxID=1896222 RepID=UPI002A7EDB77|nr:glycosyltransferase [Hallerella succinigenes]MDY5030028.1 glycosyltransferase [Hallerella succinigenes]